MDILQHLLKDILIKFRDEKLSNDLQNIEIDRKKYNNELNKLLKSDNLIIEKYYKLQTGGTTHPQVFDETTVNKLDSLISLLTQLQRITPSQIAEKKNKLLTITNKILAEIETIDSHHFDAAKLFDKIPQILDTTSMDITSTTKGFNIGSTLSNLTIPLDINGVTYDASGKITGDFINSKKLNEIMNKMKRSYDRTVKSRNP